MFYFQLSECTKDFINIAVILQTTSSDPQLQKFLSSLDDPCYRTGVVLAGEEIEVVKSFDCTTSECVEDVKKYRASGRYGH